MIWAIIIPGFLTGAMGSLHCAGMCGPLCLSLPLYNWHGLRKFMALLLYQCGRIITYSFFGLLLGLAGRKIYISGFQQWFSIAAGIILLLSALFYFKRKKISGLTFTGKFYRHVQTAIGRLICSPPRFLTFIILGMLNGLLPCGMVYLAGAASLSFSETWQSVLFMAMFGAGTLPVMMLAGYAFRLLSPHWKSDLRKLAPVFISVMGALLILRGLNLGIPFISPALPSPANNAVTCHP